jgi:hypothetical protein
LYRRRDVHQHRVREQRGLRPAGRPFWYLSVQKLHAGLGRLLPCRGARRASLRRLAVAAHGWCSSCRQRNSRGCRGACCASPAGGHMHHSKAAFAKMKRRPACLSSLQNVKIYIPLPATAQTPQVNQVSGGSCCQDRRWWPACEGRCPLGVWFDLGRDRAGFPNTMNTADMRPCILPAPHGQLHCLLSMETLRLPCCTAADRWRLAVRHAQVEPRVVHRPH